MAVVIVTTSLDGRQTTPRASLRLSAEQAASLQQAWNDRLGHVPGEVLVKFEPGVSQGAGVRATAAIRGGIDPASTHWVGDVLVMHAEREPDAEALAATLRRQPEVRWAQPNYLRHPSGVPNDTGYTRQWNFELIGVPRAWDVGGGGSNEILVAVVDTGAVTTNETFSFTLWTGRTFEQVAFPFRTNPDLDAARVAAGRDFVFWDGPVVDMVGHGTHVAGTVLQETNNQLGQAGIAHRARLLPLKACFGYWELQLALSERGRPGFVRPDQTGACPDSAIVEAIQFAADNGAHVINLSLGGVEPSPAIREMLQYAVDRGSFVAVAVGNEFTTGNPVTYPAKYAEEIEGVVAVGAVGRSEERAYYSNTGSHVELVAPGGDTRQGGLPGAIYQSSLYDSDFDPTRVIRPRFERYAEVPYQGTSMAAPHVAGVAALLYAHGLRRPQGVEAVLKASARDLGPEGRDPDYGAGLIDAPKALSLVR